MFQPGSQARVNLATNSSHRRTRLAHQSGRLHRPASVRKCHHRPARQQTHRYNCRQRTTPPHGRLTACLTKTHGLHSTLNRCPLARQRRTRKRSHILAILRVSSGQRCRGSVDGFGCSDLAQRLDFRWRRRCNRRRCGLPTSEDQHDQDL